MLTKQSPEVSRPSDPQRDNGGDKRARDLYTADEAHVTCTTSN